MKTHSMIVDPSLTCIVTGVLLRYGTCGQKMEDAVAEVLVRTLEAVEGKRCPETLEEWKAIAAKIAAEYGIDEARKKKTKDKYDEGPCEAPDEHPPLEAAGGRDPVDRKRQLEVLLGMFERGEMPEGGQEILMGSPTV